MKHTTSKRNTTWQTKHTSQSRSSAGQSAISMAPPNYGIDFIDREMSAAAPLQRGTGSWIQPKLMVGPAGDSYEREADRVADQVISRMVPAEKQAAQLPAADGGQQIPARPLGRAIEEEGNVKDLMREEEQQVRKKHLGRAVGHKSITSSLAGRIEQSKGRGNPLPSAIQHNTEAKLGYDFSGVRVQTGADAADMAQQLGARAFTHGSNIWLGSEASVNDARLMAHEMTHVVQQGAAPTVTSTGGSSLNTPKRQVPGAAHVGIALKDTTGSVRMAPAYPNMDTIAADKTVEAARAADWTAGETDNKERSGWVMWHEKTSKFDVVNKKTGTWEGVNPGPTPADAAPKYCVGHYHQHPPLPAGKDKSKFPVGPSGADTSFANGRNNPGIVRDFTTKARTTVTNYKYGPNKRA